MTFNACNNVGKITNYIDSTSILSVTPVGDKLVYSNFPESYFPYNMAESGKFFYRDPAVNARARVFFHHFNGATSSNYVVVRVRNTGTQTLTIYTSRYGTGTGDPRHASVNSWIGWLNSSSTDTYKGTVNAGGFIDLIQLNVAANSGAAGLIHFVAVDSSSIIRPVEVTVFACNSPANVTTSVMNSWTYDKNTDANYNTIGYGGLVRGTFPHCSRNISVSVQTSASRSNRFIFGEKPSISIMPNEYEIGIDYTQTGNVWINGNYGVDYNFTANITNSANKSYLYGYLQDSGFYNLYLIADGAYYGTCDKTVSPGYGTAWNFDTTALSPGGLVSPSIWYTLPGGNTSAVELHWA
jgi:hypothetical protein